MDLPGFTAHLPVFPQLQRVRDRGADRARGAARIVVDREAATSLRALAPWWDGPGPLREITPLPRRE